MKTKKKMHNFQERKLDKVDPSRKFTILIDNGPY